MVLTTRCEVWQYFHNIIEEGAAVCKMCKQRMKNDRTDALRKHIRTLHNAKSEVWNYFDNIVKEGMAVCRQCKEKVRNNRSINLIQHLEKEHNIKLFYLEEGSKKKLKNRSQASSTTKLDNPTLDISDDSKDMPAQSSHEYVKQSVVVQENQFEAQSSEPLIIIPMSQKHVNQSMNDDSSTSTFNEQISTYSLVNVCDPGLKRKLTDANTGENMRSIKHLRFEVDGKTLMSAVWGLMVDDGITPALFGSKHMQVLLQPLCDAASEKEKREFKIDEAEAERILCLVANKMRNDFSNDLDSRLLSLKIDVDIIVQEKTFYVSALFVDHGNIQTRILGVIDLKNDPQLSEHRIKEVLHKFNIDSNQIIYICWDNKNLKCDKQIKSSEYLKEIELFEKFPDVQFGNIKLERYASVIAQLCLLDIFKNSNIFQPFLECRNFVSLINEKFNCYEILKIPLLDSPWRLGSTYEMMHDLHEAIIILRSIKSPEDQFNISDNLWSFIDAYCKSLIFLQKSINKYLKEEMHFGDFYAQWLKTKFLTQKLATDNNEKNTHITLITTELLKSIEARTKELLDQDCFKACLYLDPRFNHILNGKERAQAWEYLKKVWSLSKIYNAQVINTTIKSEDELCGSQQLVDDGDVFLTEFLSQDMEHPDKHATDIYENIVGLKFPLTSVDTNILGYWHNQKEMDPEIYALSTICFAIPTTQNCTQNRHTNIYKTEAFSTLSTYTRDNLTLLSLNSHILEGIPEQIELFRADRLSDEERLQELPETTAMMQRP